MEKARIQAENDELKDQLMKLSEQMEEQSKKAKTQMEVKDVEIVLLKERIAMLVESNLYLDSQEEQIIVKVEATTPKTSPLVSSMIKNVKNRETRKEHKDPDFWYITKRQPKQNKTIDEVEPMVKESAKTRKEEQTQHQQPTKQIDTSYPVFHKLPKKLRMKLTSLWETKTSSYPIVQRNEVGNYLYLDDIDKIVKYKELSGNAINAYKEILMAEEQSKPKFNVTSSRKRLSRPETRSYTAKRQKREKEDNNETEKQQDNKEETTRTETTSKQQEREKRQKHEPANEAQKQAQAKERIRKQQQCIKDVVSSLMTLFMPERRSLTVKIQKQEEKQNKETKKQQGNKQETARTETTSKQQEREKRQKHEPTNEAQKQAQAKERIRKQQQCIKVDILSKKNVEKADSIKYDDVVAKI
ncbi:golgin subfamily A member 6-like protein 22 [Camellia sinensis]|uniref:golgin subfamily A member 6-like protein 22 n=1 Tax=Camellia sinensis TaxID=4442 RepID=UPI001036B613|nr:golgin subfamily A member 6-like protein 22 [Camellia sinensis]